MGVITLEKTIRLRKETPPIKKLMDCLSNLPKDRQLPLPLSKDYFSKATSSHPFQI